MASSALPPASRADSVRILLRLEALALALVSVIFYAHNGTSWILFAALWIAPDLSMLGYLRNSCWGARLYNAAHTYVVPAALAAIGWLLHNQLSLALALIWINHITTDRLLGYGLKYAEGFGVTHLGRLGKPRPATPPR